MTSNDNEGKDLENNFKESENSYRRLAKNLPGIVYRVLIKENNKMIFFNDMLQSMTGYASEELIKGDVCSIEPLIDPKDRENVTHIVTDAIKKDHSFEIEYRFQHKDGRSKWFLERGRPIRDIDGNLEFIEGVIFDITDRKKAEEQLKESEEKYKNLSEELEQIVEHRTHELKESEQKFKSITEQSIVGIVIIQDDLVKYVNEQLLNLTGYSEEEVRNWKQRDLFKVVHPEDRDFIIEQVIKKESGKNDVINQYEVKLIKKNGKVIWVHIYSKTMNYGDHPADLAVLINVTKQKEIEQKLKESEEKYRNLIESLPTIIWEADLKSRITYINSIGLEQLGYTQDDFKKGLYALQFIAPEDRKRGQRDKRHLFDGKEVNTQEYKLQKKDGTPIYIRENSRLIYKNGKLFGALSVIHNITEIKKLEDGLYHEQDLIQTLLENHPDFIYFKDCEARFQHISKCFCEFFGSRIEDILGKTDLELFPEEVAKQTYNEDLQVIKTGIPLINKEENAAEVWVQTTKIPWFDKKGNKKGLFGISHDITERKKAEQRLKESEEKYREAYYLANFYKDLFMHDMSNILQGIISSINFHSMFRNDPERLKALGDLNEVVKSHAKRGTDLISKVRKVSKLAERDIQLRPIEIHDVMNESVENTIKSFQERNVNVKINGLSKDLKVLGNEFLIDIFDNILNNAVKYNTNEEEVKIDVEISKVKEENTLCLKIEFKDYGMGVSDEKKKHLFEQLYIADISRRGMGIGLSLVKQIVDKYGGKIWVEDRIKGDYTKGSNFVLLLKEAL